MNNSKITNVFNYVLLTFIILWSGGGFTYGLFPYWMLYAFPIVGLVFLSNKYKFSSSDCKILLFLSFVLILQYLRFNGTPIRIISPIFIMVVCMMASHLLLRDFSIIFVNIIYFFALVSLILWCINLIPWGHVFIDNIARVLPQLGWENLSEMENNSVHNVRSVYLFSISDSEYILPRNEGPFWEPGRFTIYLALALAINLFGRKGNNTNLKSIVLLGADITTFSTTGYSALVLVMLFYVLDYLKINRVLKFLLVVLLLYAAIYVWQLDFISSKINEQANQLDVTYSRFGAIYYHWSQIVKSPFIGYGPFLSVNFMELAISPNGLTDLMRYFGIPAAIFLYVLLYRGTIIYIESNRKLLRLGTFIVLLVLCFSQTITYAPFFYLLYFFGIRK